MAGLKRKEAPLANTHTNQALKKSKKSAAQGKTPKNEPSMLEAETDSDPIIESDTTEHSGDDDGASWPSGKEEEGSQLSGKDEISTDRSTREDDPVKRPAGTDDNSGKINQGGYYLRYMSNSSHSQFFEGSSCKAKGFGSRTQSGETERGLDSSNQENLGTPA